MKTFTVTLTEPQFCLVREMLFARIDTCLEANAYEGTLFPPDYYPLESLTMALDRYVAGVEVAV